MRLTKLLLSVLAALGLSTGAVFAGGDSMTHESSQGEYSMQSPEYSAQSPQEYFAQGPESEAYEADIAPSEIVLMPEEEDLGEPPVLGNELG